jgi:hypothetical protein
VARYAISPVEVEKLAAGLAEYYESAWKAGVKGLFDNMARANMGKVTAYLDLANDTYANIKKKATDPFLLTFKRDVTTYVRFYFANRNDVAGDLTTIATAILTFAAAKIPVPHVGAVLSKAITYASGKVQAELHERSIKEADQQIATRAGAAGPTAFVSDVDAADKAKNAIDQYKSIAKYVTLLPTTIQTLEDAITLPGMVWKIQETVSSLNVTLWGLRQYLDAMGEKLEQTQKLSKQGIDQIRKDMPTVVTGVLDASYNKGMEKGKVDIARKKYAAAPAPTFKAAEAPGGASQLAARVAHALAQGYFDSGNTGPIPGGFGQMAATRPRR